MLTIERSQVVQSLIYADTTGAELEYRLAA
jgi:hypothetical protein